MNTAASPRAAPLHYARMLIRSQRRFAASVNKLGTLRLVAANDRQAAPLRPAPQRVEELAAA